MQLHSPFHFLRRHALAIVMLFIVIVGYFVAVGWVGTRLRDDVGQALQAAPTSADQQPAR